MKLKKYILDTPRTVGDMKNQIALSEFGILHQSFNLEGLTDPAKTSTFYVALYELGNGFIHSMTYEGTQAEDFYSQMNSGNFSTVPLQQRIFEKLQTEPDASGFVLPPGTIQDLVA